MLEKCEQGEHCNGWLTSAYQPHNKQAPSSSDEVDLYGYAVNATRLDTCQRSCNVIVWECVPCAAADVEAAWESIKLRGLGPHLESREERTGGLKERSGEGGMMRSW